MTSNWLYDKIKYKEEEDKEDDDEDNDEDKEENQKKTIHKRDLYGTKKCGLKLI